MKTCCQLAGWSEWTRIAESWRLSNPVSGRGSELDKPKTQPMLSGLREHARDLAGCVQQASDGRRGARFVNTGRSIARRRGLKLRGQSPLLRAGAFFALKIQKRLSAMLLRSKKRRFMARLESPIRMELLTMHRE